jgi:hypothetical protein
MKQLFLLALLTCSLLSFGQETVTLKGKLFDNEFNKEPLAFVSISVKGTDIRTNSELDGSYSIENLKPGEYVLVYSFIGYENQEQIIHTKDFEDRDLNVVMKANSLSLNESKMQDVKRDNTSGSLSLKKNQQ